MKVRRNSNIELLRILAASGVILLHFNSVGGIDYSQSVVNKFFLYVMESVNICAVNLFILISAYFLVNDNKRNVLKIIELLMQVVCFSTGMYILAVCFGKYEITVTNIIRFILPRNYFVIFYCVTYLISPYINILLKNLSEDERKKCVLICIVLFSVYPTVIDILCDFTSLDLNNLSTITRTGSTYGYSIVQFILMYLIGASLRLSSCRRSKKSVTLFCWWVGLVLFTAFIGFVINIRINNGDFSLGVVWSYCNPLIIIMAVLIFNIFKNMNLPEIKSVNKLAKGCFTIYLLHPYLLSAFPYEIISDFNIVQLISLLLGILIIIWLVSYFVFLIWDFIIKKITNKINIKKITYSVEV